MNLRNKGVKQWQIAKKMKVSRPRISELENGKYDPLLSTYLKYVDACGKEVKIVDKEKR